LHIQSPTHTLSSPIIAAMKIENEKTKIEKKTLVNAMMISEVSTPWA
jgi:hypothetical protein